MDGAKYNPFVKIKNYGNSTPTGCGHPGLHFVADEQIADLSQNKFCLIAEHSFFAKHTLNNFCNLLE